MVEILAPPAHEALADGDTLRSNRGRAAGVIARESMDRPRSRRRAVSSILGPRRELRGSVSAHAGPDQRVGAARYVRHARAGPRSSTAAGNAGTVAPRSRLERSVGGAYGFSD